jgi:SAM-dependent methyltransferase
MTYRAALKAITPIYKAYKLYQYSAFPLKLAWTMLHDWTYRSHPGDLPMVPAKLRFRVHGALDWEGFLQTGQTLAQNVRDLLAMVGHDLSAFERILDFGCGAGRVLRHFLDAPTSCRFYGTDIDAEAITWGQRYMPQVCWTTNSDMPPTPFTAETFDLIYAISVFTHLNEEYQFAWLSELHRIAKPGALLILTVHGEHLYREQPPSIQQKLQARGILFRTGMTGRLKLDGLPDFYQETFHTREYIHREWTQYFEILHYADRAIANHQDAILLRNR